jgi:hypothetical protein
MKAKVTRIQRSEPRRARIPRGRWDDDDDRACLACGEDFRSDDWVVDVPIGPGASEENRDLLRRGFEFEAFTVPCHLACVTGYDKPGMSDTERAFRASALQSEVETYVAFQEKSPEDRAREVAVAAQGLRDPSFDEARYIAWRRANIVAAIKGLGETIDPERLVAEYGGTW